MLKKTTCCKGKGIVSDMDTWVDPVGRKAYTEVGSGGSRDDISKHKSIVNTEKRSVPLSRGLEEQPLKLLVLLLQSSGRNLVLGIVLVNKVRHDCFTLKIDNQCVSTMFESFLGVVVPRTSHSVNPVSLSMSAGTRPLGLIATNEGNFVSLKVDQDQYDEEPEEGDSLRLPFVQVQVLSFVANSKSFEGDDDLGKLIKHISAILLHTISCKSRVRTRNPLGAGSRRYAQKQGESAIPLQSATEARKVLT